MRSHSLRQGRSRLQNDDLGHCCHLAERIEAEKRTYEPFLTLSQIWSGLIDTSGGHLQVRGLSSPGALGSGKIHSRGQVYSTSKPTRPLHFKWHVGSSSLASSNVRLSQPVQHVEVLRSQDRSIVASGSETAHVYATCTVNFRVFDTCATLPYSNHWSLPLIRCFCRMREKRKPQGESGAR